MNRFLKYLWTIIMIPIGAQVIHMTLSVQTPTEGNRIGVIICTVILLIMVSICAAVFNNWLIDRYDPDWRNYLKKHLSKDIKLLNVEDDYCLSDKVYLVSCKTTFEKIAEYRKITKNTVLDKSFKRIIYDNNYDNYEYYGEYRIEGVPLFIDTKHSRLIDLKIDKKEVRYIPIPIIERFKTILNNAKRYIHVNGNVDQEFYYLTNDPFVVMCHFSIPVTITFAIDRKCIIGKSFKDFYDTLNDNTLHEEIR